MPRKGAVARRESVGDPKYDSVMVTRFVSAIMSQGKRSVAERQFYGAMRQIEEKTGQDAMTVLKQAMTNVKPALEVKSRRVGGANYQVPVEVRPERRNALATRWIIMNARTRSDQTFAEKTVIGQRIAHGMLSMAVATGLANQMGIFEGTTVALMTQTIQYKGMVKFGDTIRIVMNVKERKETKNPSRGVVVFDVPILNQRDEVVVQSEWMLMMARKPQA